MRGACGACAAAVGLLGLLLEATHHVPPECLKRSSGTVGSASGERPHWPSSLGHHGKYGVSPVAGPRNLTQAYSWTYESPSGRFRTPGLGGSVIDAEKNIYLAANDKMIKFSPDGKVLWEVANKFHCQHPVSQPKVMMNSPSLWGDAIFGSLETGSVFALSTATGQELWSTQILQENLLPGTTNNGFVQAHAGYVVADAFWHVHALNATDGSKLWRFTPDKPVWNFLAAFPDDGTVLFQDWSGKAYRLRLADGKLLWKAGGVSWTWTDGSIMAGPNGLVYAVNTFSEFGHPPAKPHGGAITAYRISSGERVWQKNVAEPPNNVPVVGNLRRGPRLSLVQPMGMQAMPGAQYFVLALDAETGEQQWIFRGPMQVGRHQAMRDVGPELQAVISPTCIPNPWSAPTIDSTGTVYIANQEGPIFALRDANGDGEVSGEGEVDSYETLRGFCGSEAPSLAPGLMSIASCDSMYVFRWSEESATVA